MMHQAQRPDNHPSMLLDRAKAISSRLLRQEKLRSIEHRPRHHPSRRWAIYINDSFFYGFGGTDYGAVYLPKALIDFGDLEGFCAWYTPPQP